VGRVIGDGGCFFQVVVIAVEPAHQRRGLGKLIMGEIMAFLGVHVPPSGHVNLIADGQAKELYAQFGFTPTAPHSSGMALDPARVASSASPPQGGHRS
jgi:GNAT superfamily N-acetyltransferase